MGSCTRFPRPHSKRSSARVRSLGARASEGVSTGRTRPGVSVRSKKASVMGPPSCFACCSLFAPREDLVFEDVEHDLALLLETIEGVWLEDLA